MIDTKQLQGVKSKLKQFFKCIDEQNTSLIIILDDDEIWLEDIKKQIGEDQNVIIISDLKEFRSFIVQNGCSKLFIDVNFSDANGIDLAEEMALNKGFAELFFISDSLPSVDDAMRIHKLGATYFEKRKVLRLFETMKEA